MAGLKELLLSEKLNTHAISLQLTAQSQVQLGGRKLREDTKEIKNEKDTRDPNSYRPKRARKEWNIYKKYQNWWLNIYLNYYVSTDMLTKVVSICA